MQSTKRHSETDDDPERQSYRHSDDDDDEDDDPSRRRIVMIHDENGVPIPTAMGRFVYDSVRSNSHSHNSNVHVQPIQNYKLHETSTTTSSEDSHRRLASQLRRGNSTHARGVDLSSSSDEEVTPNNHSNQKHSPSHHQSPNIDTISSSNFVDDDSTLDREEISDKFANQFMRIEIEASKLKDVSAVTKDLHHDRQDRGTAPKIMVGLQRIVSNTKDGERLRPTAVGGRTMQNSVSGLQRTSSFLGGVHRSRSGSEARPSDQPHETYPERSRDNQGKGKRQALASIGRVLSINRNKTPSKSITITNQNTKTDAKPTSSTAINPNPPPKHSTISVNGNMSSTGAIDLTEEPHSQQSFTSGATDRPRDSDRNIGGVAAHKRAALSQVGRLLSRNRAKSTTNIDISSQHGNDVCRANLAEDMRESSLDRMKTVMKPRASLSRIGRMISLKRSKPESTESGGEAAVLNNGSTKVSPMSSSTVSSTSMGDINSNDRSRRDRDRGRESTSRGPDVKRESRLSLRNVGRMFSLTRRSGIISVNGDSGLQRKLALSGGTDNTPKEIGKGKKETVSAPGTSKADKFVNSEVTSDAIVDSGVLGGSTHIRVAVIAMAEFSEPLSRDKWFIDVFTLPHNAVRRECMDLYDILSALARCDKNNDLCREDIDNFETWWKVADQFLRCYFEVERRVLFPWVDSAGAQEWEVQLALKKMRSLKDKLETLLSKMERIWKEKTFKTSAEMYGLLYKAADEFVPRLVNYFMDQEVLLPAIVKEFYSRDQRLPIDKQMVEVFMNEYRQGDGDDTRHNLVLLVRWMSKSRQLRAWLGKNLAASARAMYPSWYQRYESQHAGVLQALRSRATTSVMSEQ